MKEVLLLTGAGQIGMAIARRIGYGKKIIVGDKKLEKAQTITKIMTDAGFEAVALETDISSRISIQNMIEEGQKYGPITMLVNAAGISPSQAPMESILKVDLYGTAVLLEEVGKVIDFGGVGVTISSQSGKRMPQLSVEEDRMLACTPTEELQPLVDAWRNSNPMITHFWWSVDHAVKECINKRRPTETHGICLDYQSAMLFITLPSGRRLAYVKPRIGENIFCGESVTYEGVGGTKKLERLESYGPKFVETIVQATACDILCYAMQTLKRCVIVAHVYDEIIIEADQKMSLSAVCEQMGKYAAPGQRS